MSKILIKIRSFFSAHPGWLVALIFFLLSLAMFYRIIFSAGVPGLRHDWFVPLDAAGLAQWFTQALNPWIDARGGYPMPYWSDLAIRLIFGALGVIGLSGEFFAKIMLLAIIVLAGIFSYNFFRKLTQSSFWPSLLGALFYVFNPLVFNKVVAGHTYYLISYALAPLFLWLVYILTDPAVNPFKTGRGWSLILLAGFILALCGVQLQFPVLLGVFSIIMTLIGRRSIKRLTLLAIPFFFSCLLIHLPWLANLLANGLLYDSQTANTPSTFSWFVHNSSQLYQAFFLLGGGNDYWSSVLLEYHILSPWLMVAAGFLVIVLIALPRIGRDSFYYFLCLIVSILILCVDHLFPNFSWWLLSRSMIFNIFREVYHLTFFVAINLSVLLVMVIQYFFSRGHWLGKFVMLLFFFYALPFFIGGNLIGNVQNFQPDLSYQSAIDSEHRILVLPSLQPLLWQDQPYSGADPSIYYSPTTSLSQMGYFGSLNERFATFFQSELYFNTAKIATHLPRYLNMFDVSSVIYRPEFSSNIVRFTNLFNYPEKNKLISNQTIEKALLPFRHLINQTNQAWKLYQFDVPAKIVPAAACLATGSWSDLNNIYQLSGDFACDGVIFAKDENYQDIQSVPVILNNNNWYDFLLHLPGNTVIEPGVYATDSMNPDESWVSAEHAWWFHPQLAGYSKLLAFTATPANLYINRADLPSGSYRVLIEIFQHSGGGEMEFTYGDWNRLVNAQSLNLGFYWTDLGPISFNQEEDLKIVSHDGDNAIGQILFVPSSEYESQVKNLVDYLAGSPKIILNDTEQTAQSSYFNLDLNGYSNFHRNFPELSEYNINSTANEVIIDATFTGTADQDEFATLIYPVDFIPGQFPIVTLSSQVEQEDIQFWEIGFEIDENNNKEADTVIWQRLKSGQSIINLPELFNQSDYRLDLDKIKIVNLRFQPHKEYVVNMPDRAQAQYQFTLGDIQFHSANNKVIRLTRRANMLTMENLVRIPSEKINFNDQKIDFYNESPDIKHEITKTDSQIIVHSEFTDDRESTEFSKVVINTNIDLLLYPYLTLDLEIDDRDLQFYDLAFGIDSDYDHQIDQTIWVNPIIFSGHNRQTVFYDVFSLMQSKVDGYHQPKIMTIELLAHKKYLVDVPVHPVNFTIGRICSYHEDALNQSLINPLPTFRNQLNVPVTGQYLLFLNMENTQSQTIYGTVNGQNFQLDLSADQSGWIKAGQFNLNQGNNNLIIVGYNQMVTIHQVAATDLANPPTDQSTTIEYQKISPVEYRADVKLKRAGYVLFKETYHPAWRVEAVNRVTGEILEIRPIIMNGWQQGYYFNQPGDYQLSFKYDLTPLYRITFIITVIFLIIMLVNILYYCIIVTKSLTVDKKSV